MISENRIYHFRGNLKINKSELLENDCSPQDDLVNWLFLSFDERMLSFVYKIIEPSKAKYKDSFIVKLSFTMNKLLDDFELYKPYNVFRGQEFIGEVTLIERLYRTTK